MNWWTPAPPAGGAEHFLRDSSDVLKPWSSQTGSQNLWIHGGMLDRTGSGSCASPILSDGTTERLPDEDTWSVAPPTAAETRQEVYLNYILSSDWPIRNQMRFTWWPWWCHPDRGPRSLSCTWKHLTDLLLNRWVTLNHSRHPDWLIDWLVDWLIRSG